MNLNQIKSYPIQPTTALRINKDPQCGPRTCLFQTSFMLYYTQPHTLLQPHWPSFISIPTMIPPTRAVTHAFPSSLHLVTPTQSSNLTSGITSSGSPPWLLQLDQTPFSGSQSTRYLSFMKYFLSYNLTLVWLQMSIYIIYIYVHYIYDIYKVHILLKKWFCFILMLIVD